jgi:hypothetical protein
LRIATVDIVGKADSLERVLAAEDLRAFDLKQMQSGHQIEAASERHPLSLCDIPHKSARLAFMDIERQLAMLAEGRLGVGPDVADGSD